MSHTARSIQRPCVNIDCNEHVPRERGKRRTCSPACEHIVNRYQSNKRQCIYDHGLGRRAFLSGLAALGIAGVASWEVGADNPFQNIRYDDARAIVTDLKIQLAGGSGAPPLHRARTNVIETATRLLHATHHLNPIHTLEIHGECLDLLADAGVVGETRNTHHAVLTLCRQAEAYWCEYRDYPKLARRLIQKGNQYRIHADSCTKGDAAWWETCRQAHRCYRDAQHILRAAYNGYNGATVYPLLFQAVLWELRLLVVYFEERGPKVDQCFAEFQRVAEQAETYSSPFLCNERGREEASFWLTAKADDGSVAEPLLLAAEQELANAPLYLQPHSGWYSQLRPATLLYAKHASKVNEVARCVQLYLDHMREQESPLLRNVLQWQQFERADWFQKHNIASRLTGPPLHIQRDALPPSISSGILPNLYAHELWWELERPLTRV